MPRNTQPVVWSQPTLLPPEFICVEVKVVIHGASGSANVSLKVYDPDGSDVWAMEVAPVVEIGEAGDRAAVLLAAGVTVGTSLAPAF